MVRGRKGDLGTIASVSILTAIVSGAVLTPLLLPWFRGRAFSNMHGSLPPWGFQGDERPSGDQRPGRVHGMRWCVRNCPAGAITVKAGVLACAAGIINAALGRKGDCCCVVEGGGSASGICC